MEGQSERGAGVNFGWREEDRTGWLVVGRTKSWKQVFLVRVRWQQRDELGWNPRLCVVGR